MDSDWLVRVVLSARDPGGRELARIPPATATARSPTLRAHGDSADPDRAAVSSATSLSVLRPTPRLVKPEERQAILAARRRAVHERFAR